VSQATISRGVKALLESEVPCPMCASMVPREQLDTELDPDDPWATPKTPNGLRPIGFTITWAERSHGCSTR
jgi:hypothetical protein